MSVPNVNSADGSERETVVGINFGNSYASIAIITKEGKAECIANEDGERQIAAAISFHGEEIYIGNQATPQLIKNSANTIINFRNLLGKKFSEISVSVLESSLVPSAPIIQHPSIPDTPCYAVQVLVPAPTPLPRSAFVTPTPPPSSRPSTQNPTPLDTPRSEPTVQTRHVTPYDAAVIFLRSLHQSATDFLGNASRGVVLTVPPSFDDAQRAALESAAKEAGLNVLQLLEEDTAAAALLVDQDNQANVGQGLDRTTLLVDWGATDLTISLLSIKAGLVHVLGSKRVPELGTSQPGSIDEVLIKYFAKEFSKKTGESLQVCPVNQSSARAQTRLFLALPHVKRSLTSVTTSSKSAQISIESLHNGLDFSSALNRTRASGLFAPVFDRFSVAVKSLLESIEGWNDKGVWVDSIAWVGGGGCVGLGAGAASVLLASGLVGEDAKDEVLGAPEEVLACGSALHARHVIDLDEDLRVAVQDVRVTQRTIGILIPDKEEEDGLGGQWIPIIVSETPLPARRIVTFGVTSAGDPLTTVPLEVWEASEYVRVRVIPAEVYSDAEDDEEPPEPTEEKERGIKKEVYFGALEVPISLPAESTGKKNKAKVRKVEVKADVGSDGAVEVAAREEGAAEWVKLALTVPSS